MQEHPIPQAVTSYEFHLIGNMTLKQFIELAAGIVLGVVVYQTNLPAFLKWPVVIFFAGMGALIAFVPYEGRPMDQWVVALFRAIYKPTQFFWKKSAEIPGFLSYEKKAESVVTQDIDLSPYRQQRIFEYIKTLPNQESIDPLEYQEMQQVSNIMGLFNTVQVQNVQAVEQLTKPDLTATPHSLQSLESLYSEQTQQEQAVEAEPPLQSHEPVSVPEVLPVQLSTPEVNEAQIEAQPQAPVQTESIDIFSNTPVAPTTNQVNNDAQAVQTSTQLPFPKKPTQPNIVVGMVFDAQGNIVPNAIVEISDEQGMPMRAVKTNTIGQFFVSTPLKDGQYYLKVEKDGILFPDQKLTLNNTLLDPLEIRASA